MSGESASPASGPRDYVRKETFLARYPRKLKLVVAGGVLCLPLVFYVLVDHYRAGQSVSTPAIQGVSSHDSSVKRADYEERSAPKPQIEKTQQALEAARINDAEDRNERMVPAPEKNLTEITSVGELPRIGDDGRKPWQVYARPFDSRDNRPRIAVVILDLGLSRTATDEAIIKLPAGVTLAFDGQSLAAGAWLARARQDGHETLLSLPMEPFDFPNSDPGPGSLLTNLPNSDNIKRLRSFLRVGTGYVGITTSSGSRFTSDPVKMTPVLEEIGRRGLLLFDSRVAPHSVAKDLAKNFSVPASSATLQIDRDLSPKAIDSALAQLERSARISGRAVGVAYPLPVTIDRLERWIKKMPEKDLVLAPVSAVVE